MPPSGADEPEAARFAAQVDALAALLGLPLAPEHRPGVIRYFALAAGMADLVMALPLGVEDEPAEAFVPIEAPERPAPADGTGRR